jgi:hypothetical protein
MKARMRVFLEQNDVGALLRDQSGGGGSRRPAANY